MTPHHPSAYHRGVPPTRSRFASVPATLVRGLVAIVLSVGACGTARADVATVDGLDAPIVRIVMRSGDLTIRTWDRPSVAVDGDPTLSVVRRTMRQQTDQTTVLIPRAGAANGAHPSLPAESFVVSTIPVGPHDVVLIKSRGDAPAAHAIVTVPSASVFVFAYARKGNLDVHGLRTATFVGFTGHGTMTLDHLGGTVFAQTGRGALDVSDSTLERMRARSLVGDIVFQRCRIRQIEVSSVAGSIVYDAGTFDLGLAHFESVRGDVAIGTQTPGQFGGHAAGTGRVFTNFERGARIAGSPSDAHVVVGGGGPVVTATTQTGNVYLYDGSIRSRGHLPPPWRAPLETIDGRRKHDRVRLQQKFPHDRDVEFPRVLR